MKIVKFTAENFKRLVAVEIKPDGNTIVITGKNAAGKSSVLDAIVAAFNGGKALPDKPIRDGEDSARIEIETEEFVVKRTFTKKGSYLEITNTKGFKAPSPQAMLDKIVGQIAFDPLAFSRQEPRAQCATLMELLGLDFSDIDEQTMGVKHDRSIAKREKERLQHEADRITFTRNLPEEEVSMAELTSKLQAAMTHNAKQGELRTATGNFVLDIERLGDVCREQDKIIARLEDEIKQATAVLDTSAAKQDELLHKKDAVFNAIQDDIPLEDIQAEIALAETTNASIRQNQQKEKLEAGAEDQAVAFSSLGQKLKELEAERAGRLAEADMPVKGLSVLDTCVTYNGLPLSQVNSAKQLEIGVTISMALNPTLKVLRMDGNNLDSDSLAVISNLVKDNGYQAWIEKVDETGKVGIVIEDGQVISRNSTG